MGTFALVGGVLLGLGLLAAAVWVWRWDSSPGSGLRFFPAAHVRAYSKALSIVLAALGVVWLVLLARASL